MNVADALSRMDGVGGKAGWSWIVSANMDDMRHRTKYIILAVHH